ncbi:hypothetical protein STRTUCAR8_07079, partial [Streptomyces turgidiscabies Car8]
EQPELPFQMPFRRLLSRRQPRPPPRPYEAVDGLGQVLPHDPRQCVHPLRILGQHLRHPPGFQQRADQPGQFGYLPGSPERQLDLPQIGVQPFEVAPQLVELGGELRRRVREVRQLLPLRRGDQRARAVQPGDDDRPVRPRQTREGQHQAHQPARAPGDVLAGLQEPQEPKRPAVSCRSTGSHGSP